jgi:hypothetical protein
MKPFEHITTLLSFVYALALAHLLARIVALFDARARVRFSGLQALMSVNAIQLVFLNWLSLWQLRTVSVWDFGSIAANFVLGVILFFICAIAAPHTADGSIDLEAYYQHAREPYYWLNIAGLVVTELTNLDFLKSADPSQIWPWTVAVICGIAACALALAVPARWAQWTAGVTFALLCLTIGVTQGNLQ